MMLFQNPAINVRIPIQSSTYYSVLPVFNCIVAELPYTGKCGLDGHVHGDFLVHNTHFRDIDGPPVVEKLDAMPEIRQRNATQTYGMLPVYVQHGHGRFSRTGSISES